MKRKLGKPYVKRRTSAEQAEVDNQSTLTDYLLRMQKIATSMFEWQNLPETMDERYLERSLFYDGQAAMLWSDKYSAFVNTRACAADKLNIYGLPTRINCYSYDFNEYRLLYSSPGASGRTKNEECILVLNNRERLPTVTTVYLFAQRLADAQRSADVNINAQKTPVVITTTENQKLTLLNAYKQVEVNAPVIFAGKGINPEEIKALRTEAPFVAEKIMEYKRLIWNEFLTFLGVNNLEKKKERLIADESEQNNEVINFNLQSFLVPRQQAAKEFNEKYGLSGDKEVKVRVRSDLYNIIKQANSIVNDYPEVNQVQEASNE